MIAHADRFDEMPDDRSDTRASNDQTRCTPEQKDEILIKESDVCVCVGDARGATGKQWKMHRILVPTSDPDIEIIAETDDEYLLWEWMGPDEWYPCIIAKADMRNCVAIFRAKQENNRLQEQHIHDEKFQEIELGTAHTRRAILGIIGTAVIGGAIAAAVSYSIAKHRK